MGDALGLPNDFFVDSRRKEVEGVISGEADAKFPEKRAHRIATDDQLESKFSRTKFDAIPQRDRCSNPF